MSESNRNGRWEFDKDGNVHYVPPNDPFNEPNYANRDPADAFRNAVNNKRSNHRRESGWHWILIVLGFMVWWPVGLALLFAELSGKWPAVLSSNSTRTNTTNSTAGTQTTTSTHTTASAQATWTTEKKKKADSKQQTATQRKARKDEDSKHGFGNIRSLRIIGSILAGVFGFSFVMELIDQISYFSSMHYLFGETLPLLALSLVGLTLLVVATSRDKKRKKFRKYLTMIGNRDTISFSALASAMGVSERNVIDDLDEMLDRNYFETGYLDAARQCLVVHSDGVQDAPFSEPAEESAPASELSNSEATLRRIRQLNDAIAHPGLSRKIDRIEELTAKIFRLQDERPEKSGELRQFMNFYLPQTLKMLEIYSKMESQGVEGENIAEAKQKIEAMMDKLVDGYETLLDKLFAEDVIDISADLKVMENMLAKDGLTADAELKF